MGLANAEPGIPGKASEFERMKIADGSHRGKDSIRFPCLCGKPLKALP
jgi:hypothetical protein